MASHARGIQVPHKRAGSRVRALSASALLAPERIERSILLVRRQRVILDADLAELYGVPTKVFNQAVKRNAERFPEDFRFQLSRAERDEVVTACDHLRRLRFSPFLPWAFTEHGAVMAAHVLNSPRAVTVSILVVRVFVRLRHILSSHQDLARRIEALEHQFTDRTAEHETHIRQIYRLLDELMTPPVPAKKGRIGFRSPECGVGGKVSRPGAVPGSRTAGPGEQRWQPFR